MFVYRDTSDDTEAASGPVTATDVPSRPAADQEAAYWYGRAEDKAQVSAEPERGPFEPVRGPFEPMRHPPSGAAHPPEPAGQASGSANQSDPASPASLAGQTPQQRQARADSPEPGAPDGAGPAPVVPDERSDQHARKLEQIKDLYLTAETIGEANVARHFDQFLAQQRELIGDYIKQSKAALHEETPTADPTAT